MGNIISLDDLRRGGNGHASASQRREQMLREQINARDGLIAHLRALVLLMLEDKGGEFRVAEERLAAMFLHGGTFAAGPAEDAPGVVVFRIVARPEAEPEPGGHRPAEA